METVTWVDERVLYDHFKSKSNDELVHWKSDSDQSSMVIL